MADAIHDVSGALLQTEHPQTVAAAFSAPSSLTVTQTLQRLYQDALGNPREFTADENKGLSSSVVTYAEPWVEEH